MDFLLLLVEYIRVPLVVFVAAVLPLWIVFHYITIWKREKRERRHVRGAYKELDELAHRLERRIDLVERLLDAEDPDWRLKDEQ